ncbi:SRPBCC domain-containing protein [Alteromonas sp. KUL49]|uniref:SRPBCC domain-containing protein n=1 Tax=Alteromonas sp. KUL49 TaxID=2480798 RepID=UPI00102EFEF5|nr:SRPBCC domain-containing protein [Alteromonas sp. KUL49]TAP35912.1 hypothetical protein EYS00_18100 [Alteromonas sp. KUL49]GEA13302.1 ATPase [Alteromonas sp. KUL49]
MINRSALNFLIATLIVISPVCFSEVTRSSNYGFSLTNSIHTKASDKALYQALVNRVDQWWPKDHSWWEGTMRIDAFAGGCFCETSDNQSAEHMRVSMVVPNQKLVMIGGLGPLRDMGLSGALVWSITPFDEGTRITLTYTVNGVIESNAEGLAAIVDQVQLQQLSALVTYSELQQVD